MNLSALIYDCEIINCVPSRDGDDDDSYSYCKGWNDKVGMGISVICAYDYLTEMPRILLRDNFAEFAALVKEREHIIGFNSRYFDDELCRANGIEVTTTYDILVEVRRATGQPDEYVRGQSRSGYSLNNLVRANCGVTKSGDGAQAPQLWQDGKIGSVVDYCLRDVMLTKRLLDRRTLKNPNGGERFELAPLTQPKFAKYQEVEIDHEDNEDGAYIVNIYRVFPLDPWQYELRFLKSDNSITAYEDELTAK